MKKISSYISSMLAMLALSVTAVSCQDSFDAPGMTAPEATWEANTTIYDLKTEFWDDADNYIKEIGAKPDGSHYIVKGRVITSDEENNIFRSLTIQDETAALPFSIYAYSLYMNYRVGQEIVVDLTGLHIGKYNGLQQVGDPEYYDKGQVWEASFMTLEEFKQHIQLNGFPEPDKVIVHQMTSFADLGTSKESLIRWQGELIRVNNVTFKPVATNSKTGEVVTTFGLYQENVNQEIVDSDNNPMTLRTSGYSNFFFYEMPKEAADFQGWLSYYQGAWQAMIINYKDIMNVGNPTLKPGSESNPLDVAAAVAMIENDETFEGWIEGYIVGTVKMQVTEVTSSEDIDFSDDPDLDNTVVIGLNPEATELSELLVMALPQGSLMRDYVALYNHPENLGKKLTVNGRLAKYLGTYGVTYENYVDPVNVQFHLEGVETPDIPTDPSAPGLGTGTEDSPFNVTQVRAGDATGTGVWVQGYIVGWVEGAKLEEGANFTIPASSASNVLLAPTQGETDVNKCIAVQLVSGSDVRSAVNLLDNPSNLGREVKLQGSIEKYFGVPGVKSTSAYKFLGDAPENPGTPDTPTPGEGDGTENSPFSVGDVRGGSATGTSVWVDGYIVGWVNGTKLEEGATFTTPATVASNLLLAAKAGETNVNNCIAVQLVSNTDVRAALNLIDNPSNLGRKVKIQGSIEKYFGVPGLKSTTAYKFDGDTPGTPDTPVDPNPGTDNTIYSGLTANADDWTIDNGTLPEGLTYVWAWSSQYTCLKGSAYTSQAFATDALAYHAIDLSGYTDATVNFQHCYRYGADTQKSLTLVVREQGTTSWTTLTIPNWNDGTKFTFTDSGNISLKAYAGKKIEIGFRYTSTAAAAATWEVKSFKVTGTK